MAAMLFGIIFLRFYQLFNNKISNGTKCRVLQRQRLPFDDHIFIGVGKAMAIGWPLIIDAAIIIGAKKWTRSRFRNKVAVVIHPQILFNEITFFQLQVFADSFDIRCLESRRIIFTTVRALQAVDLRKSFFM